MEQRVFVENDTAFCLLIFNKVMLILLHFDFVLKKYVFLHFRFSIDKEDMEIKVNSFCAVKLEFTFKDELRESYIRQ